MRPLVTAFLCCIALVLPSLSWSQTAVPAQTSVAFAEPDNLFPSIQPLIPAAPTLVLTDPRPASPTPRGLTGASKGQFFVLSTLVYAAATTDMVSTHDRIRSEQECPVCYLYPFSERDPFARPFVRLPTPAYFASGYLVFTGVNLIAWRMSRSSRWHRYWRIPQMVSLAGSSWGISTFH
jgi:hypothetical protein